MVSGFDIQVHYHAEATEPCKFGLARTSLPIARAIPTVLIIAHSHDQRYRPDVCAADEFHRYGILVLMSEQKWDSYRDPVS